MTVLHPPAKGTALIHSLWTFSQKRSNISATMTKNIILAAIGALIIVAIATAAYLTYRNQEEPIEDQTPEPVTINSFEECAAAGNPIMESYPRQCRAGGRTFVEEIPEPEEEDLSDLIVVDSLAANDAIASPLTITGQARGNWYFEASFPVRLLDAAGNELAIGIAQAQGDWMTTEFVPFTVTLTFTEPATGTGTLVLQKDNPSGLPENDNQLEIPVTFGP